MQVTVITPTLPGRARLLDECVSSVAAQTRKTVHLVEKDEGREGPATVRNRLVSLAETEWVLPLDDDDLLDPDCVQLLVDHAGADVDVVYPWCRVEGKNDWCPNRLYNPDSLLRYNYIPVTALIRKTLHETIGGYRTMETGEDWDYWLRALGAGAVFKCVPEVCWTYRILASGESRNQWDNT